MLLLGPKVWLFLAVLTISPEWITLGSMLSEADDVSQMTAESFTEDPNLVSDPATDETASPNDKNATSECRDEKFPCTRLDSVYRPVKQCINTLCFTSVRRMYIINNEICSRLVCKKHEVVKDELCRQMAGLSPRRLHRSSYFRLPPCEH